MADAWGGSFGVAWGASWGAGAVAPSATPGFHRRVHIPDQSRGESEAEKLARRILEGTIQAPIAPPLVDFGADYAKKSVRLAAGIARFRAEAEISRKAIAKLEATQRKRQTAALRKQLLHAQQALQLATVQEAVLMEEMEVIDVAYFAHLTLRMIQ